MRISDWSSDVCSSDLLGERAERPGDEPAGQDEGGDRAAGDRALRDPFGAVPEQRRNRAEQQADNRRGDDRAKADAAFRGREIGLDSGRETIGFARLLTERLDDLHRPHLLGGRSEEHTSELQSLMRISYAVFCLKKKTTQTINTTNTYS